MTNISIPMLDAAPDNANVNPASAGDVSQRLCLPCQILSLSHITGDGFIFHRNFRQLSAVANDTSDGCCDLCFIIWWSLRWHSSKLGELDTTDVVLYKNPPNDDPVQRIEVVVAPEHKRNVFSWFEHGDGLHHLGPPDDKPWLARGYVNVFATNGYSRYRKSKPLVRYCLPADNAGSSVCLDLASRWLSDCLEHHGDTCRSVIDSPFPSRLIDVGRGRTESIRLIASENAQPGAYFALSYCWGREPFFLMTSDNRSELEKSIDLEKLPKTVQDAITLTRRLGVRYLWVDSLCIIQGTDKEALKDWNEESQCMNSVYRGALATILASSAAGAHEGIFADRNGPAGVSCTLPVFTGGCEIVHLVGETEDAMLQPEPLSQRAWAFQEDFLSIRALSFGTDQLTWRCRGSESTFQTRPWEHGAFEIHESWRLIVEEYSGKDLTIPTDKLPAIAGLTRVVQAYLPPYYFSGLWEDRVVEQLLWKHLGRVIDGRSQHTRLKDERVPSWSWASVDGRIEFLQGADPSYCKILRLSDQCIVAQAHVQKIPTIRLTVTASYFGGYDNYLPWAAFPASMRTHLDDPDAVPKEYRKVAAGSPDELIDISFLFLGLDCGLIVLKERGSARRSSQGYGHLRWRSEGSVGGDALRSSLELPVRREYKRIGSFVGFRHDPGLGVRRRLPSTTVYLI